MRGTEELRDRKVVRDVEDICSNRRGHCGDEGTGTLLAEAITIGFHQFPQTRSCVRNHISSGYKSPREITQHSSIPSHSQYQPPRTTQPSRNGPHISCFCLLSEL